MPACMSRVQSDRQNAGEISTKLLAHYNAHARELPWRIPPSRSGEERPEPYHVWLSEIMLQQTTVAAVIPYFEKFMALWPNVADLAVADEADVMAAWAGLGYYARARNLLKCAKTLVDEYGGTFPTTEAGLLKLPGIGPYTAAAIAAIAFGERAIVVDANIERVVSRLFEIATPLPKGKEDIRAATENITPAKRSGDFAQAMMDLGASICSVKAPACLACPLSDNCAAHLAGEAERYPIKPPKKAKPHRQGRAFWIEKNDAVWLIKRPDKGMLGGMRALPDDGWYSRSDGDSQPPFSSDWQKTGVQIDHVFTHFSLTLSLAVTESDIPGKLAENGEWWPVKSLDKAGLPTLFMKAVREWKKKREF